MIEHGTPMGCSDSGPPESYSDEQLSRAYDVVTAIRAHARGTVTDDDIKCQCRNGCNHYEMTVGEVERSMIEACIPQRMRFEMTWSRWQYRSAR